MKSLSILLIFLIGIACDTVKDFPENTKENAAQKETAESSDNSLPNQDLEVPGRIAFKAKVVESFSDKKDICGVSRSNVVQVEVIEILEGGSGITNLPHKNDVLLVSFLLTPKDLNPDKIISARAKESLCPEASKTYFIINSYEILE